MPTTISPTTFFRSTKLFFFFSSVIFSTIILSFFCLSAFADTERGVLIYPATIYLTPDRSAEKLATMTRGDEVVVLEKSHEWIHVLATVHSGQEHEDEEGGFTNAHDISGWILDKGAVRASTPNGGHILFGAAAEAEDQASRAHGRKGAGAEAFRLYSRTTEYFPQSPVAGEALYRAADIRWQLDKEDVMSRPSAKMRDPGMREPINEDMMHQVMKKFPGSKWADLAAFHLIENKLCGDWQGNSKCPEKESERYEKYAEEHPSSPTAPEALYDAAWRQAALIEIYKTENNAGKSAQAKSRASSLAQQLVSKYSQSDWASRGQTLIYMVEQNIPTYGNATE
jgi:hypothetical protein